MTCKTIPYSGPTYKSLLIRFSFNIFLPPTLRVNVAISYVEKSGMIAINSRVVVDKVENRKTFFFFLK